MGVVLKNIAKAEFTDNKMEFMDFELNDGPVIHLQNDVMRLEFDPNQFYQFAVGVIESANKLIESKKL